MLFNRRRPLETYKEYRDRMERKRETMHTMANISAAVLALICIGCAIANVLP